MSKINRLNDNVQAFALDAMGQERTVFGENTQSNELDDNVNGSFKRGYGIYGPNDVPTRADFNAVGFTLSQMTAYLYQAGLAEWQQEQEFFIGSFTNYAGRLYVSDIDDNVGINPNNNISSFIGSGVFENFTVEQSSSMLSFESYLGLANKFAYIDPTNIYLKLYHTDSMDFSDVSVTSLVSLGITPSNNIVSCRISENRFFLGYDNQWHIIEADFNTGLLTIKYSDTTTILAKSGGLPYTCSFKPEYISSGVYDMVYLLINGEVETWKYNISTLAFTVQDSVVTPDSFTPGSSIAHVAEHPRDINDPVLIVEAGIFAVTDIATGLLSVYMDAYDGVLLATEQYGDNKFAFNTQDYHFIITSNDPSTNQDLVQRLILDLSYVDQNNFTASINVISDKFDLNSTGLTSIISLQDGNFTTSNRNLDTIQTYYFNDDPVAGWSLLGSENFSFDGTGTALVSTNIQDAIKEVASSMIFPVGSIYESAIDDNTNPSVTLGFGTWAQIEGRMLIGVDATDIELDTAGTEGGNRVLTAAGHALTIAQMPSHSHTSPASGGSTNSSGPNTRFESDNTGTVTTNATGGGEEHSHNISGETDTSSLPPFLTVYMWRRTA